MITIPGILPRIFSTPSFLSTGYARARTQSAVLSIFHTCIYGLDLTLSVKLFSDVRVTVTQALSVFYDFVKGHFLSMERDVSFDAEDRRQNKANDVQNHDRITFLCQVSGDRYIRVNLITDGIHGRSVKAPV